jgi:anti-anti-sigma regulatory factor
MEPPADRIYFGESSNTLHIRASGRATSSLCLNLRQAVDRSLAKPDPAERVRIDLSECTYMDSTFIGLLVGLTKRLAGAVTVENPSAACRAALEDLGLCGILAIPQSPGRFPDDLAPLEATPITPELLLEAHEALSKTNADNRARFRLVKEMLKNRPVEP